MSSGAVVLIVPLFIFTAIDRGWFEQMRGPSAQP
jgi:hypothetical protein